MGNPAIEMATDASTLGWGQSAMDKVPKACGPTRQGPPHPSTIRDPSSPKKPNETDGMSVVRQYYETRGVSKSAVRLLMASWRGGTKKQYPGYIKK